MNQKHWVLIDIFFTVFLVVVFFFMLPGLAAGLGVMGSYYFDGLKEIPPFGLKAACAAVAMLALSALICSFIKADKGFMVWPQKMTLVGLILLPLAEGYKRLSALEPLENRSKADVLAIAHKGVSGLIDGIMLIAPAALCTVSVFLLALGLTIELRSHFRKKFR